MTTASLHPVAQLTSTVISFLRDIGIPVIEGPLEGFCFLPGIQIAGGTLKVDPEQLKYPGDLLHEAGHIAVVPAAERSSLNEQTISERAHREAEEMMAIAWSYAVCVHLGIDAGFVFHDHGYKNGGSSIAENFREGRYFGVPMLQWVGMALERKKEEEPDKPVYPHMLKWLRD